MAETNNPGLKRAAEICQEAHDAHREALNDARLMTESFERHMNALSICQSLKRKFLAETNMSEIMDESEDYLNNLITDIPPDITPFN